MNINKFLDFDGDKQIVYYNLFLNDDEILIKIPIISISKSENQMEKIKIESFNLINYDDRFLLNCEQNL